MYVAVCAVAKKREMDDNSRRIGALFWKLNEGQVAPHVLQKLLQLCAALDAGNWPAAAHIQVCCGLLVMLAVYAFMSCIRFHVM